MATLRISLTNEDRGHLFSEWSEELDDDYSDGEVYRMAQREYGRCMGKVYVDPAAGGAPKPVGWFFVSRQRYEDTAEPYLRGAWVTLSR